MKTYFTLWFRMTGRKISAFGLPPALGYLIGAAGFVAVSMMLFERSAYAEYIYLLFVLGILSRFGEIRRNDFLKTVFNGRDFRRVRITENAVAALPFFLMLLYGGFYPAAGILVIMVVLLARVNFNAGPAQTLPTPFARDPFEFTAGFRSAFLIILFAYTLAVFAVLKTNFNLGGFALLLIFLTILSFYSKPENEFYVWIYNRTPKGFLLEKIKIALEYSTLLSLPVFVIVAIFFRDQIYMLVLLQFLGYIYLLTMILAKYAAYPDEISIPAAMMFGLSLFFPPILIVVMLYFYTQSVKRLELLLE